MGESILNGLTEQNLSKQHNVRIRKLPGNTVDDLNYHVHPIFRKKPKHIIVHLGTNMPPLQHLGGYFTSNRSTIFNTN